MFLLKSSSVRHFAASVLVLVGMALVIGLASHTSTTWDGTSDRRHTLAADTETALTTLERPVAIRFYFPQADNTLPVALRHFGERVDALLRTVAEAAGGKVIITRLDSSTDPEAAQSAVLDGHDPTPLPRGGEAFLGLTFESGVDRELLASLSPGQGGGLE